MIPQIPTVFTDLCQASLEVMAMPDAMTTNTLNPLRKADLIEARFHLTETHLRMVIV